MKPRVGDVVIIKANDPSVHPSNNGWLGLIIAHDFLGYKVQTGVSPWPNTTTQLPDYTYFRAKNLIIIDHIDDADSTNRNDELLILPGNPQSWLLAIDMSASRNEDDLEQVCKFIKKYEAELNNKVKCTVTFDLEIRNKLTKLSSVLPLPEPRGGTDVTCVLEYALTHAFNNVLIISDGGFVYPKDEQRLNVFLVNPPDNTLKQILWDTAPSIMHAKSPIVREYAKEHGIPIIDIKLSGDTSAKDILCDTDQFHWPYNAKPSMMKCEEHSDAKYIDGYFVNLITHAPEGIIEVQCHNCGHKIKEIKLDLAKEDPRLKKFCAFKS